MTLFDKIDRYKGAIDEVRPFEGDMLKQLKDYYRVGLTWTSNALEGNTLTESETKVLIEDGMTIGGKPLKDIYEAVGHGEAYDFMFTLIRNSSISIEDIRRIHRLFYQKIDESNAGQWRKQSIIVSGTDYVFPAANEIEEEMQKLGIWIEENRQTMHPVKFAAMLHLKFVTVHPFIDGNGRTARLIMNLALIQKGYQPVIVPMIYKQEYNGDIRLYQNKGNAQPFVNFIAQQEDEAQKEIMRLLHIPIPV